MLGLAAIGGAAADVRRTAPFVRVGKLGIRPRSLGGRREVPDCD